MMNLFQLSVKLMRKLAHTSTSATIPACAGDMPTRAKMSEAKRVSAAGVIVVAGVATGVLSLIASGEASSPGASSNRAAVSDEDL